MNVRPADPQQTFMKVKMSKEGKPVGIIVKRRYPTRSSNNKNKKQKVLAKREEEIPEIIGVRVADNNDDAFNVYRNGQIVNNTLVRQKLLFSREK